MPNLLSLMRLLLVVIFLASCNQNKNDSFKTISESQDFSIKSKKQTDQIDLERIDTTFIYDRKKYDFLESEKLEIINSYPKGVIDYIDFRGNTFSYVVFWSLLSNQTDKAIHINIAFPRDSLVLNSSPKTFIKLYIPKEFPAPEKLSEFNYGLRNIRTDLDKHLGQPSTLKEIIYPNQSRMFYVVALFDKRIDGVVRSGLYLEDLNLLYHINGLDFNAGSIELENKE